MVDVDLQLLIAVGLAEAGRGQGVGRGSGWEEFPDVVLCDVVGVVGTAADLVEGAAVGQLDLVRVQVVLGLEVAEDEGVCECVRLAQRVELVQRPVQQLQLLLPHLHDAAHEDRAVLLGDFGDGVVQVFAEGGVDVGGEAGGVDALLLLDHLLRTPLAAAAPLSPPALLVRLPLLLLRVADSHIIISTTHYKPTTATPPPSSHTPNSNTAVHSRNKHRPNSRGTSLSAHVNGQAVCSACGGGGRWEVAAAKSVFGFESTCIIFQMFKRLMVWLALLLTVAVCEQPFLLLSSAHTHDAFQLSLSIAADTQFELYSKKLVRGGDHWTHVSTASSPATISPAVAGQVLVNSEHEGRHVIEYYEKTVSNDLNRHFHYLAVRRGEETIGYLLPSFSERTPAIRTDRLYKCHNTLASVEWIDGSAHVVVFSQQDPWRIAEQIDDGFRSDERGLYYGYAIDHGHTHPIKLHIADRRYCLIDQATLPAAISFNWTSRENYELNDVLYIAGQSLPVVDASARPEEL